MKPPLGALEAAQGIAAVGLWYLFGTKLTELYEAAIN
jgi:hypothetical protein